MVRIHCDTRASVFVEHVIVSLPILMVALSSWQMIELWTGQSLVAHAAAAAARAAVVVLTDDPAFYGGVPIDRFEGARRRDVELAASLVLASSPHFRSKPELEVSGAAGRGLLTVTVRAPFECFAAWVSWACRGARRMLSATVTEPYQEARYVYAASDAAEPARGMP